MSHLDKLKKILSKSTSLNGDVRIAGEFVKLEERLEEVENTVNEKEKITVNLIKELKGEDGKDGYTPRKNIDYFDGENGLDGYTPVKGKDYFDGQPGRDGVDADYDIILEHILKEVPVYELKGSEVVESINALPIEKEYQIDASHIKNLPQIQNFNGGGWRNLYQMHDVEFTNLASGDILTYDGIKWINSAFDDNGILSLNGLTGAIQTFAVGTAGTDFGISSVGTTHTFNLPTASATNRGALSSADWSTFNAKQNAITGTDTQILFFDGANNPAGHSGLTYDKTTGTLTIDNILSSITNNFNLVADDGVFVTATGSNINLVANGYVRVKSGLTSEYAQFDTLALTTSRNVAFQDADGTVAYLSDLSAYEPVITAGTVNDYWRGDKTFQTLDTLAVPENTNLYFTEPRVLATVLTGLNVTGGAIVGTDTVLEAFGKAQNQINGLIGGVFYQGTWDALTNTPTLASGVGTQGHYYVVSVAGSTNLDGITTWSIGDWAIFNGTAWEKVDNTDAVISVNSAVGAVSLTGTANRITVTGTQWDIAATYVGQSSITTLGTVTTGVWNGTAIANANLANSSLTIGSTNIALGATSTTLAGLTSVTSTSFVGALTGNASTATTLQTARTIGIATGDVTSAGSSFNGGANNTNAYTLATVNANVGTFGSATQSVQFTVNGKGLITAAANVTVTPAVGSITGLGTGVSTFLATPSSANLLAAVTDETGTGALVFGTSPTFTTQITTPIVIGGTSSGGSLLLQSTTNVVKGVVQFEGTSSSHPGLFRSGQNLRVVRADNSAYSNIEVAFDTYGGGWSGVHEVPAKNDVYDAINALPVPDIGVLTPTISNESNTSSTSVYPSQYQSVTKTTLNLAVYTVSGRFTTTASSAGVASFEMETPILSSNFINGDYEAGGVAFCVATGETAEIKAIVSSPNIQVTWNAVNTSAQDWTYHYTYSKRI